MTKFKSAGAEYAEPVLGVPRNYESLREGWFIVRQGCLTYYVVNDAGLVGDWKILSRVILIVFVYRRGCKE